MNKEASHQLAIISMDLGIIGSAIDRNNNNKDMVEAYDNINHRILILNDILADQINLSTYISDLDIDNMIKLFKTSDKQEIRMHDNIVECILMKRINGKEIQPSIIIEGILYNQYELKNKKYIIVVRFQNGVIKE